MYACMHAHTIHVEVMLTYVGSHCWQFDHNTLPASRISIYHPHISINNQGGMQLVTWKGYKSHVTDQSSREVAHSLG